MGDLAVRAPRRLRDVADVEAGHPETHRAPARRARHRRSARGAAAARRSAVAAHGGLTPARRADAPGRPAPSLRARSLRAPERARSERAARAGGARTSAPACRLRVARALARLPARNRRRDHDGGSEQRARDDARHRGRVRSDQRARARVRAAPASAAGRRPRQQRARAPRRIAPHPARTGLGRSSLLPAFRACWACAPQAATRADSTSRARRWRSISRFYARLLRGLGDTRVNPRTLRIDVTPIGPGREDILARTVIEPLAAEFPVATVTLDLERDRAARVLPRCLRAHLHRHAGRREAGDRRRRIHRLDAAVARQPQGTAADHGHRAGATERRVDPFRAAAPWPRRCPCRRS